MENKNLLLDLIFKDYDVTLRESICSNIEIHDINIFDDLGFDSISFIQLIVDIERNFEIEIDDNMLLMENFSTVGQIENIISKTKE